MKRLFLSVSICMALLVGCSGDFDEIRVDVEDLQKRVAELENSVSELNADIVSVKRLMDASTIIVGLTQKGPASDPTGYSLELSDGTVIEVWEGKKIDHMQPIFGVDAQGYWIMSFDGGETFSGIKDGAGEPVKALPQAGDAGDGGKVGVTPKVKIDAQGYWMISLDDGKTFTHLEEGGKFVSAVSGSSYSGFFNDVVYDAVAGTLTLSHIDGGESVLPVVSDFSLTIASENAIEHFISGESRTFAVQQTGVKEVVIEVPQGWKAVLSEAELAVTAPQEESAGTIKIIAVSDKNYLRTVSLAVSSSVGTPAWQEFVTGSPDNVLVDFSYAGYKHGEVAPPDVSTLGYKIFSVADYGAIPNDGKSDRAAFIATADAVKANGSGIIYFPEGEWELHLATDDTKVWSEDIIITMGNFVIKGAGRDRTTISMSAPNVPQHPENMYDSRVLINIKHNSGLVDLTTVTGDSPKGTFSVEVASTAGIKVGDWVCLYLKNNDRELILQELGSQKRYDNINIAGYQIFDDGVWVEDFHQVASISGNTVTFVEPLMHGVEAKWGWQVKKYNHYENVGVEDITFKGNAKPDFKHHGSWNDDGGFKPINLMRLTNSWMRRVRFTSVSECSSIVSCANVSVYDVEIDGNRGHASIRSQGSSRVFIGKVYDHSSGPLTDNPSQIKADAGQYHAVGVAKPSMGAVLWRNDWGDDSCFEAHATQPRATLIDYCSGAMLTKRQGGDYPQMPNHLDDLTIWNFNETLYEAKIPWWDYNQRSRKFMPPTIVGYNGSATFDPSDVKLDEGHGANVHPESLYEAQLKLRLGALPAWLNELK